MDRNSRLRLRRVGGLGVVLAAAAGLSGVAATPAAGVRVSETVRIGTAKTLSVSYRGNGHGHGMSQYGARGAARAGLSYRRILAFYYPGTSLVTVAHRTIRVKIAGTGRTATVYPQSRMTVTGVHGYLPTSGVHGYRLVGATAGVSLQRMGTAKGSKWHNYRTGLPNRSEFHRPAGMPIRVHLANQSSTTYLGAIRAVRTPGGVITVNRVGLNSYVAGVVPREMPASWERAAVDAQAVAARTYAAQALASSAGAEYDICATTQCQVYGGLAHYARNGAWLTSQFARAALDTSYQVLHYRGAPAFTQFSASNGGWSVAGGEPYLVAKADPYDTPGRSLDPDINVTTKVSVSSIARYFGLARVTSISITARDGHGTWKGRVLAGSVTGINAAGHKKVVPADGFDFADVFQLGTTWLRLITPAA